MAMLEIMEKYGWDWFQYHEQPTWIIDAILQKMSIESKVREHDNQK